MPTLAQGRPLDSDRPTVVVENALAFGRHRFALIVIDGDGRESMPDELVLEVPEDEVERVRVRVPELMSSVAELKVPLLAEVGVGANWDEAH